VSKRLVMRASSLDVSEQPESVASEDVNGMKRAGASDPPRPEVV